ncbi:hypothetical protein H8F21_13570 [Pseudomonas sp. P66]|uniref:DUF2975 domain-containing protein n=1 Tax=Pseudomonas arcuscaelestis TaxID=2710591 RepID=A0ABS2BYA0_9PSED|nr:hypothetical protein [Pseudomonas arcuscaelestis]MBM5458593.1 hypothetical protein [Pseudomonas arcuscaelestis]
MKNEAPKLPAGEWKQQVADLSAIIPLTIAIVITTLFSSSDPNAKSLAQVVFAVVVTTTMITAIVSILIINRALARSRVDVTSLKPCVSNERKRVWLLGVWCLLAFAITLAQPFALMSRMGLDPGTVVMVSRSLTFALDLAMISVTAIMLSLYRMPATDESAPAEA